MGSPSPKDNPHYRSPRWQLFRQIWREPGLRVRYAIHLLRNPTQWMWLLYPSQGKPPNERLLGSSWRTKKPQSKLERSSLLTCMCHTHHLANTLKPWLRKRGKEEESKRACNPVKGRWRIYYGRKYNPRERSKSPAMTTDEFWKNVNELEDAVIKIT